MAEKEPTWAVVLHTLYETKMVGGKFDKYGSHRMLRSAAIADEVDRNRGEVLRSLSNERSGADQRTRPKHWARLHFNQKRV